MECQNATIWSKLNFTIKAGGVVAPPYVEHCFSQYPCNCSSPGQDVAFSQDILTRLGYGIEYFRCETWPECLSSLVNGTLDFLSVPGPIDSLIDNPTLDASPCVLE